MNAAEYKTMQDRVELLSRLILDTDADALNAFVAAGEHSMAFAPFVDPTAWMRGHETLRMVISHATAIASARRAISEAAEVAGASR